MLRFTASSLAVHFVMGQLITWYRLAFINKRDLWESLVEAFQFKDSLSHTPVVLIYRDGEEVRSRCLVRSWPPHLPWGIERLRRCSSCPHSLPLDIRCKWKAGVFQSDGRTLTDPHATFRMECVRCQHTSRWVSRPDWIHPVPRHTPCYWFRWPIDDVKLNALVDEFKEVQ